MFWGTYQVDSPLILTTSSDPCCYDPQVTDLENEIQRRKMTKATGATQIVGVGSHTGNPCSLTQGLNHLSVVLFAEHLLCTVIVSHLHPSPQTVTLFYREGSGGSEGLGN